MVWCSEYPKGRVKSRYRKGRTLAHSRPWDNPDHDILGDVFAFVDRYSRDKPILVRLPEGADVTWQSIFQSDLDHMTHLVEQSGYRVWFTCEVDGTEYRLCARKE